MLVAEGAATLSRPGGARLAIALGAFLLYQPAVNSLWHRFIMPRRHVGFDSHGDLAHDLLDYLEERENTKRMAETIRRAKLDRLKEIDAAPSDAHSGVTPP
jgi:hypothetical protein